MQPCPSLCAPGGRAVRHLTNRDSFGIWMSDFSNNSVILICFHLILRYFSSYFTDFFVVYFYSSGIKICIYTNMINFMNKEMQHHTLRLFTWIRTSCRKKRCKTISKKKKQFTPIKLCLSTIQMKILLKQTFIFMYTLNWFVWHKGYFPEVGNTGQGHHVYRATSHYRVTTVPPAATGHHASQTDLITTSTSQSSSERPALDSELMTHRNVHVKQRRKLDQYRNVKLV